MNKESIQGRIGELEDSRARSVGALLKADVVISSLDALFPTLGDDQKRLVRKRLRYRAKRKLSARLVETEDLIEKGHSLEKLEDMLPRVEKLVESGKLDNHEIERVKNTIRALEADIFPRSQEESQDLGGKQGRAIVESKKDREVSKARKEATVNLIESTPDAMVENLLRQMGGNFASASDEFGATSRMIISFYSGELTTPTEMDFLTARESGEDAQIEHAIKTLQGLVAYTITSQGIVQPKNPSLKQRLGLATNHLKFMLGVARGTDLVNSAIDRLNSLERVLLMQSMSTNLKQELGHPDIDDCDEVQFADYLRNALYQNFGLGERREQPIKNPDALATLITVCADRIGKDFDAGKIIDSFFERDHAADICLRLVNAARELEVLDCLEVIFQSSLRTTRFGRRCRELLHGFEDWEMLPLWQRE